MVKNPYDAKINNNIFYGNETGIERTGGLSSVVSYNCFFGNTDDFVGYPISYGQICCSNSNGDDCDIAFNIFMDPTFVSNSDWHLSGQSSCIDAGTGSAAPGDDMDGELRFAGAAHDIGIDEYVDSDTDWLADRIERLIGTDPFDLDIDEDGMRDGWEVKYGLNPLESSDAKDDNDDDGFTNLEEFIGGMNPNDPESNPFPALHGTLMLLLGD